MKESCQSCRFSRNWSKKQIGECRFNAPPIVRGIEVHDDDRFGEEAVTEWAWPMVGEEEWCGKWEADEIRVEIEKLSAKRNAEKSG